MHCSAGVHDSDPHPGFIQHLLCELFWICFFDADVLQIFSDSCIHVFTFQSFCDRMLALYSSSATCTCGPASLVSSL